MNSFKHFSAPLQGYTDHVWRKAHASVFPNSVDAYFTPFVRLEGGKFRNRDLADISTANTQGVATVPQLIACRPLEAKAIAMKFHELGYRHIDINLGCPFPLIARKHKGSGMLPYPAEVKEMLTALSSIADVTYSAKMRLGYEDASEWKEILPLFEIIRPEFITVHPRTASQQYKGEILIDEFAKFCEASAWRVVYNGEIASTADLSRILAQFPSLHGVMAGRGLLANPALFCPELTTANRFLQFYEQLELGYSAHITGGEAQLLMRLKSIWDYFLPDSPHKALKQIRKATSLAKYHAAVSEVFLNQTSI